MDKILKGLLYSTALLPLFTLKIPFTLVALKAACFQVLLIPMLLFWGIGLVRGIYKLPKMTPILWGLLGFLLWMLIPNVLAKRPELAFWSNILRMDGYMPLLYYSAYMFILVSVFKKKDFARWGYISLAVSIPIALTAILQQFHVIEIHRSGISGNYRPDAFFGNSIHLGEFALFQIFIGLHFIFETAHFRFKYPILLGLVLLNTYVLFLTDARGCILGFCVAMAIVCYRIMKNKLTFIGLCILGGLTLMTFVPRLTVFDIKRDLRVVLWDLGLQGIQQAPIIGYGQENFSVVKIISKDPKKPNSYFGHEYGIDKLHNVFLDWAVWGGLPALFLYCKLLWGMGHILWRKQKTMLLLGFIAYIVQNAVFFDTVNTYIPFFILLAYCVKIDENNTDIAV